MGSRRRIRSYGLAAAVSLGVLLSVVPAGASVKGRRNTAYALTAVAIYSMATGNTKAGFVTGAGAAYAWKRTIDEKKANERAAARRARYCRTHRAYYRTTSCHKGHHYASKRRHHVARSHHHHRQYARR